MTPPTSRGSWMIARSDVPVMSKDVVNVAGHLPNVLEYRRTGLPPSQDDETSRHPLADAAPAHSPMAAFGVRAVS